MFREDNLRRTVFANLQIMTRWDHRQRRPLTARAAGTRRLGYVSWSGNVTKHHAKTSYFICIIHRHT